LIRARLRLNKAFRICILASDSVKLQSTDAWAAGISVSDWEFRPPDAAKAAAAAAAAAREGGSNGLGGEVEAAKGMDESIIRLMDECRKGMGEGSDTEHDSS
jgi:hypothetical protein